MIKTRQEIARDIQTKKMVKLIGTKFGKLIIIAITDEYNKSKKRLVECICDCGTQCVIVLENMRCGRTTSCGCLRLSNALTQAKKGSATLLKMGITKEPKIATATKVWRSNYSDGDLSFDEFYLLAQMVCSYCGKEPSNTANAYTNSRNTATPERRSEAFWTYNGLDRVDNTQGHNKNNIVPCCRDCNIAKNDRTKEEFLLWISNVYHLHFS